MGPHTSPALARRQLRLAPRRERARLTQVAVALEWSISKVNRIETGDIKVSSSDLAAPPRLLHVADPAVVADFREQGRASRRRGWWNEPSMGRHLPPTYRQLIEFEAATWLLLSTGARGSRLHVRILPFREGTPWTAVGGFFLCDVEEEENVLLYQETAIGDQMVQASEQVRHYRARFDRMWGLSLDEEASARLMRARAAAIASVARP